jgi:hypothetical protein
MVTRAAIRWSADGGLIHISGCGRGNDARRLGMVTGRRKSRHRDEAMTASFLLVTIETSLYRRAPTRLTPPFALPPAL